MAQWIMVIFAGVTLLILWTSTVIGAAIWLMSKLNELKKEILDDFKNKHEENSKKVQAMEVLVMRHDLILEPEFNGSASGSRRAKQ
jgi:hypothetical protein